MIILSQHANAIQKEGDKKYAGTNANTLLRETRVMLHKPFFKSDQIKL